MSGNTPLFRSETNENEKDVTLRQGRAIGFRMYDQQAVEAHNVSFLFGDCILHYHVLTSKRESDEGGLWETY